LAKVTHCKHLNYRSLSKFSNEIWRTLCVRVVLDSLSFYKKNWFLALAHKNWFLKKLDWGVWRPAFKI
jgi:hypothetical protein